MNRQRLGDRYELEEEIAVGGMGRVVRALDERLDRPVAVKTLLASTHAQTRLRFLEEAQITGQLAHPNIIPIHELGRDGDELFLSMKLVEGRDLKQLVKELDRGDVLATREYGLRRLLRVFLQICEAMAYAHERGVVHRDLKPANVMLGQDDNVLVMDWGISKPVGHRLPNPRSELVQTQARSAPGGSGDLTMQGSLMGTPAYMPPEQLDEARDVDTRADVYSLGAILYELLTYRAPYRGEAMEVLSELMDGPPDSPSVVAPEQKIPPPVEAICLKAMARNPGERYPDAAALAADVEAYLDGRSVTAHEEGVLESLVRLTQRHKSSLRTVLAMGAAALLLSLGGWFAAQYQVDQAKAHQRAEADSAAVADLARQRADLALESAQLALQASRRANTANAQLARFLRLARSASPLDAILSAHTRTRDALHTEHQALLEQQAALRAAQDALPEPDDDPPGAGRNFADDPLESFSSARRHLDSAFAEALVSRAPSRAVGPRGLLDGLDLGPHTWIFRARAHLRLGDRAAALAAIPPDKQQISLASGAHTYLPGYLWTALRSLTDGKASLQLQIQHFSQALTYFYPARDPLLRGQVRPNDADLERDDARALHLTHSWLHLRRGELLARAGDLRAAQLDFERAAELSPADPAVYLAQLREVTPHWSDASTRLALVEVVGRLSPELEPRAQLLHKVHSLWSPDAYVRYEDFALEVRALQDQQLVTPQEALSALAEGALVRGRSELAERHATALLQTAAGAQRAYAVGLQARALVSEGRWIDATRKIRDARLVDEHPSLSYVRGLASLYAEDVTDQDLLDNLRHAAGASLEPGPWLALARGHLLFARRTTDPRQHTIHLERGFEAARRASSLDPLNEDAHPRALPRPGDPQVHRVLAELHLLARRPAHAALHATRALLLAQRDAARTQTPPDLRDAILAGRAQEALGLTQEAAAFYRLAADDPRQAEDAARRLDALDQD